MKHFPVHSTIGMGPLKRVLIVIWSWSTAGAVCSANTIVDGNMSVNTEVSTGEADDKAASSGESDYYRLEKVLMKNYRPHLRPVHFHRTTTNLSLVVQIIAIQEVSFFLFCFLFVCLFSFVFLLSLCSVFFLFPTLN